MSTVDDVRALSLSLPDTTERPSYGRPAFRVKDKVFACLFTEPGVLVLWRQSEEEKKELIIAEPEKFFTTSHYDGYPMVLVRLAALERDELAELLEEAWLARAPARLRSGWNGPSGYRPVPEIPPPPREGSDNRRRNRSVLPPGR